jgi:peptide/nickel transport system permease protein
MTRHALTLLGCALVLVLAIAAIAAPWLTTYSPVAADPAQVLRPPGVRHWFGTDRSGMDIFARVLFAGRLDLSIATGGTLLALALGVPLGLVAGFYRGWGVEGLMRLTELVQSFPLVLLAMAFVTLTGQREINIVLAIALLNAPIFLRLVRASVLAIRGRTFVEAAISAGNPDVRLLARHILPNVIGGSLAHASVTIGWGILLTAGLSFVSIGVRVPTPEWGSMVSVGAPNMTTGEWWVAVFPGVAIGVAVLGFNLLGDGLQDLVEIR